MRRKMFGRSSFRGKPAREPRAWSRPAALTVNGSSIFNVKAGVVLFDPSTEVAGGVDERLTLMRIMVELAGSLTLTNAANPSSTHWSHGICVVDRGTSVPGGYPDPSLNAAGDREADWLYLRHEPVFITAASPVLVNINEATRNEFNTENLIDVKAKRKLSAQQLLIWVATFRDALSAVNAATLSVNVYPSILFQRTMRR